MKADLSKEVKDLQVEVDGLNEKHKVELGKLKKRLSDMDSTYKKFGKDAIARTTKFADTKAKASKEFATALNSTSKVHQETADIQASMAKMRSAITPFVDKFISGKGWPKGCKCPKAKALLQRLQATLHLASLDIDTEETSVPERREALLRRSSKMSKPAEQEKYLLVREVQQLEAKRAKLMEAKAQAITGYSQQQRITLDRIQAAKVKGNLKATQERKYKDLDTNLEKTLKGQTVAASTYLDSAKSKLARLKKSDAASLKLFKDFKAELQKCKCL